VVTVSFHIPPSLLLTVIWINYYVWYALLTVLLNKLHINKVHVIMVLYSGQLIEICVCECVTCPGYFCGSFKMLHKDVLWINPAHNSNISSPAYFPEFPSTCLVTLFTWMATIMICQSLFICMMTVNLKLASQPISGKTVACTAQAPLNQRDI
jgi:hypothetical protein